MGMPSPTVLQPGRARHGAGWGAAKEFHEQRSKRSKDRFGCSQGIPRTRPRIPRTDWGKAKEFQRQIWGQPRNSKDPAKDSKNRLGESEGTPRADLGTAREFQGPGQGFQGQI